MVGVEGGEPGLHMGFWPLYLSNVIPTHLFVFLGFFLSFTAAF